MSFYDAIRVGASGASSDLEIQRSLRFNEGDSHYLVRTPSSAGNRRTWTWSSWVKYTTSDHANYNIGIFQSGDGGVLITQSGGGNPAFKIRGYVAGSNTTTTQVFRDPSAWFHVVLAVDTTQSTSSNRVKLYINGVQVTSFSTESYPSQNAEGSGINNTSAHYIGSADSGSGRFFDGYLAEINFIDGLQLTPDSFATTNVQTGQWVAKKYAGAYGTNGFRLTFEDNSSTTAATLGKDHSGNGNNFTPNNFGGTAIDQLKDTPTNNFCTLNPLNKTNNADLREGNLEFFQSSNDESATATFGITSGKWYWEVYKNSSQNPELGIDTLVRVLSTQSAYVSNTKVMFRTNGGDQTNGAGSPISLTGSSSGQTGAGVIAIAVDFDNKKIWYSDLSGTFFNSGNPATGANEAFDFSSVSVANGAIPSVYIGTGGNNSCNFNFGQDGTFAGHTTAGGYADGNGHGNFKYSVPSGYLALCSANLPDPTIKLPNKHFDTVLYTGNGSSQTISGLNFAPDWVWIKNRNSSSGRSHILTDRVRGATKSLLLPETDAETTQAQDLTAFTSDGFSVGSNERVNENSKNLVAWNWDAGETDSATYRVVVVSDSGNKYRFRNSANSATFAQSAVTLDLAEGGTYTFDGSDSTMASHPIKLSTTSDGTHGGGSSYNTGVTYELDGSTVTESAYVSGYSSATSRKLIITVAASAPTLYYYCHVHSGMGGQANTNSTLGSSNFDGDLQSTVKVNLSAGFSIITYTGNGSSSGNVGTGFGSALPIDVAIVKRRDDTSDWQVGHRASGQGSNFAYHTNLNDTSALSGSSPYLMGSQNSSNGDRLYLASGGLVSSATYVAYCFNEVAGYSKFGYYEGNQNANGTFVYLGFTPAWIIIKNADNGTNRQWCIIDATRTTSNKSASAEVLFSTSTGVESVANNNFGQFSSKPAIDILSNGFKVREGETAAYTQLNRNNKHIYLAFAKSPFKNSRAM